MTAECGGRKLTVGILGGMGPEATVDLQRRVIELTPATGDGDHIRMLVDCDPSVPSRIAAIIEGSGPSPAPALIVSDTCASTESLSCKTAAIPPCAQNVDPAPSWLLDTTPTLKLLGSCSARLRPAAPLPIIRTS